MNKEINEVRYIEFFKTGDAPNEDLGDWNDEFGIHNYFISELSIIAYEDDIIVLEGQVFDISENEEKYLQELENRAKNIVKIDGEDVSGEFLRDLINSALWQENSYESVYEKLDEMGADLEFFEDVDDIPGDYANCFGVRIWSMDTNGLKISIEDGKIIENIEDMDTEYADLEEHISMMDEDDIAKKIAVVDIPLR